MKGKLQIELTNVNTGEKTIHREENMVTNAVPYILGIAAQMAASPTNATNDFQNILPVATKSLGGIFLFDGTLTEDKDNIHFPMDVHLTGHAGQVTNTSGALAGSINTAESGATDNGYVNVWDFTTSQGNGTIASLALTHYMGGRNPFRYGSGVGNWVTVAMTYSVRLLFYDEDTGDVYGLYQSKIYRKRMITSEIRVNSPTYSEQEEVFDFSFSNPSYGSWSVVYGYDGYIYAIYAPEVSSAGTATIRIRKVRAYDLSFEEEDEMSFQMTNVTLARTSEITYTNNSQWAINNGYLYCRSYSNAGCIYRVNLSNVADVEALTIDGYNILRLFSKRNGGLFIEVYKVGLNSSGQNTTYYYPGIMYPDGEYRISEELYLVNAFDLRDYVGYESDKLYGYRNDSGYNTTVGFCRDYLGTICNLASPVVKTSAQSMKITYTLTDVAEETETT